MSEERQIDEVPVASGRSFYLLGEGLCTRATKRGADFSQFDYHTSWVFLITEENVCMSAA